MAQHFEDEVAYYYDFHPTEEDLMGETAVHADLVHYQGVPVTHHNASRQQPLFMLHSEQTDTLSAELISQETSQERWTVSQSNSIMLGYRAYR